MLWGSCLISAIKNAILETCIPADSGASIQVEGTCSGTYGFMLMVTEIMGIGQGKIREGTGSATFHVEYTCLAFRPFKGEVLDAVVASVNKVDHASVHVVFRLAYALCHAAITCSLHLASNMKQTKLVVQMGFFADAGPLQIFVSQHLIPSHYRVEITDDASFESEENAPPIKAGAAVRVRLVGIKVEANQLVCLMLLSDMRRLMISKNSPCACCQLCCVMQFCVATIMEDFLGIVGD